MAKFIKSPNLWNQETVQAIKSGALVLQPGQWVHCGNEEGHKSRFVRYKPESDTFDCVHYPTGKKFRVRAILAKADREEWTIEQRRELITKLYH